MAILVREIYNYCNTVRFIQINTSALGPFFNGKCRMPFVLSCRNIVNEAMLAFLVQSDPI